MTETPDERAGRLARLGLDIADRIRDEDPTAVARALDGLDRGELRDMVLVLAAAVDVSVPMSVLYGWLGLAESRPGRRLQPCGTPAAAARHRARAEDVCDACAEAERAEWRDRKRQMRGAA